MVIMRVGAVGSKEPKSGFFGRFKDDREYPRDELAEEGVPQGMFYSYVSSTYLNGLVNYVRTRWVGVVQRYVNDSDPGRHGDADDPIWDDAFEARCLASADCGHPDYSKIPEDIWLLGETENSWWFFWSDQDSSDCCIGRFAKSDEELTVEQLIVEVKAQAHKTQCDNHYVEDPPGKILELPIRNGWASF